MTGKNAEAIPEYKKTLELKPDLYQAELNLGISLLQEKVSAAAAVPYLTGAAAQSPKEYRPNYYLATALLGAGDFPKAEQYYAAALVAGPEVAGLEGWVWRIQLPNKTGWRTPRVAIPRRRRSWNPSYRDDLAGIPPSLYEAAKNARAGHIDLPAVP